MTKKTVKVRLYRVQDFDLFTLYFDPVFSLGKAFCLAVTAYAEGLPAPVIDVGYVQDLPPNVPYCISTYFTLNSVNAIQMLAAASAHGHNANNLVKNLLRMSLTGINRIYFNIGTWPHDKIQMISEHDNEAISEREKTDAAGKPCRQDMNIQKIKVDNQTVTARDDTCKKANESGLINATVSNNTGSRDTEFPVKEEKVLPNIPKTEPKKMDPKISQKMPVDIFSLINDQMDNF